MLRIAEALADADVLALPRRRFVVALYPLAGPPSPGRHPLADPSTTGPRLSAGSPSSDQYPQAGPITAPAVGAPVWVAVATGRTRQLAGAYREAVSVLHVLRRTGQPAGRYDLLSVVGDRLVANGGPVTDRLREVIGQIADAPLLLDTLSHWLASDLDRRRAAAALHVHTNTLDRRLRQIEQRTGRSVTRYGDVHLLHLALSALRGHRGRPIGWE